MTKPKSALFAEGPQIWQIIKLHKLADLRFAELTLGPPTISSEWI